MKPIVVLGVSTLFLAACLTPDAVPSPERDAGAGGIGGQGGSSSAGGGGSGGAGAATGDVVWGKAFGAQYNDQRASGVAVDPTDDSIYLVGSYEGEFSFDGANNLSNEGNSDIYLAKFDSMGGFQWSVRSGDWADQYVNAIAVGGDRNIFLAGSYEGALDLPNDVKLTDIGGQSDVFVVKLNPEGATVWAKGFGDGSQQPKLATTIAVDSQGNAVIAGYFSGSLEFIPSQPISTMSNRDVFLAKLDKDGNPLWSKRLGNGDPGGPANRILCRVALDHQDNIVLETAFTGTMSLGAPLPDVAPAGSRGILLAKFAPDGKPLWQQVFGAANAEQRSRSLAVDSKNNIVLTGDMVGTVNFGGASLSTSATGDPDLFVAKFDPDGKHVFSLRAGNGQPQEGRAIAVDAHDNVIVTGSYYGVLDFNTEGTLVGSGLGGGDYDLFALKLDPNGKLVWAKAFGNGDHQYAEAMALDSKGNTIFGGSFDGNINLPNVVLTSAGYDDIFLMKLSP